MTAHWPSTPHPPAPKAASPTPLPVALGRYPHTEAFFAAPDGLDMQPFPVITRAFKPMVRDQAFAVSEMAIATFLQARAYGSDLVLLPVTMTARFQNAALLRLAANPFGPAGLRGRRVGVRAYSQTTGLWLRGILQEDTGITPQHVRWTTFEDAHVAGYADPVWAERAPPGSDMLAMLRAGDLDAAIFGAETPTDADLATVFPDPVAAGDAFWKRHRFVPVNHLVAVRAPLARQPGELRTLLERFRAARAGLPAKAQARLPFGRRALEPAIALAMQYALDQGLLPRPLTMDEVWAGLPPGCDE